MNQSVVKFGGSNLRRPGDVDRVVAAIRLYTVPPVVVVSAFYGVTNELVASVAAARRDAGNPDAPGAAAGYTRGLRDLHETILKENFVPGPQRDRVGAAVNRRLDQLERYLTGIHLIGDVPPFVNDAVLSYGERLSGLIVAEVLEDRGIPAGEFLPEGLGLTTDGVFGNAACDFATSAGPVAARLAEAAAQGRVAVVPGFYGVDGSGKATLFGRGGSDYSAASIARCVGAGSLDVWKDVDGFLSGDPTSVDGPRAIPHLHYLEAAELSYFGAKILHPRTVEPLFDQNIPIRILNIGRLERGLSPYTVVDGTRRVAEGVVKSVASTDDVGILKLHGPGVGFKAGILARVTGTLDREGINIKSVLTAQTAINLLLARGDLTAARKAVQEHHLAGVVDVGVDDGVAIVAVVGDGVLEASNLGSATASRALGAALAGGVRVTLSAAGASEVTAYLLVRREDRDKAVRLVHREFFS